MKLYHNPRCAKSREAKAILDEWGTDYQVALYMKDPLSEQELSHLLEKLEISAQELIRTQEKVWKEEFKDKELTEPELILAMIEHPRLMERPILETETRAVLGRPPEKIKTLLP